MRILAVWLIVFFCASCRCDGPTCIEPELRFRVVDSNNKDLLFDLNVPVDSIIIKSTSGDSTFNYLRKIDAPHDKFISAGLDPTISEYTISYKDRSVDVKLVWETVEIECCERINYNVAAVSFGGNTAAIDENNDSQTFIIRL